MSQATSNSFTTSVMLSTKHYQEMLTRKEELHRAEILQRAPVEAPVPITKLAEIVDSSSFETLAAFLIFVNCIFVGIEVQTFAQNPSLETPEFINVMGYIIYVAFLCEILVRIFARGLWYFFWTSPVCAWNVFDALVVAMSTIDLLLTVVMSSEGGSMSVANARIFRVIKIARLLRVVRIARIIRYASALRMLIYSITVTLKSVMWALLLFVLIIYVFAIVFTQAMIQSIIDEDLLDPGEKVQADDPRFVYWGSIFDAMYTLFKSVCSGVDWHVVAEPLRERHVFFALLFAAYVWFTYFVALNVITGAFCSSAFAAAANDPEIISMGVLVSKSKRQKEARKLFEALDLDSSGAVTISELAGRISDDDVQGLLLAIGFETSDANQLFKALDADGSGIIDVNEFVEGCMKYRGAVSNIDFVRATSESKWIMRRVAKITDQLEKLSALPLGALCGSIRESS